MTIYKQIQFSGTFKKADEDDSNPINIDNSVIFLKTNGTILLEISPELDEKINWKRFIEGMPQTEAIDKSIDSSDPSQNSDWLNQEENRKITKKSYQGNYQIYGENADGLQIKSIVDPNDSSSPSKTESLHGIKLRHLNFRGDNRDNGNDYLHKVTYGLSNIKIDSEFQFSLENINVKVSIKPITLEKKPQSHELSAEIQLIQTVTKQPEIDKDDVSLETYCAWIISLLSFISGKKVNELYRKQTSYINGRKYTEEIWSGHLINIPQGTIQVIESPLFFSFFKKCCQQINEEVFINKTSVRDKE